MKHRPSLYHISFYGYFDYKYHEYPNRIIIKLFQLNVIRT